MGAPRRKRCMGVGYMGDQWYNMSNQAEQSRETKSVWSTSSPSSSAGLTRCCRRKEDYRLLSIIGAYWRLGIGPCTDDESGLSRRRALRRGNGGRRFVFLRHSAREIDASHNFVAAIALASVNYPGFMMDLLVRARNSIMQASKENLSFIMRLMQS